VKPDCSRGYVYVACDIFLTSAFFLFFCHCVVVEMITEPLRQLFYIDTVVRVGR